jgi:hypothetical protein
VDSPKGDFADVFHDIKLGSPTGIERRAENRFRSWTLPQRDLKAVIDVDTLVALEVDKLKRLLVPDSNKPLMLKCGPNQISRSSKSGKMMSLIFAAMMFKPCIRVANSLGGLIVVFVVEVSIQSFILP